MWRKGGRNGLRLVGILLDEGNRSLRSGGRNDERQYETVRLA